MDQRLLRILGGDIKEYPHALETKYPRVFSKIMALWDSPEIDDYFMELIVDKRGGRAGFPPDIATQIVHLSLVHAAQHAEKQSTHDGWSVAAESFSGFDRGVKANRHAIKTELSLEISTRIKNLGGTPSSDGFLQAAELGNSEVVKLFLEGNFEKENRDSNGWTALMLAAFNGHLHIIDMLIRHGINLQACDAGGNTALHWAVFAGHAKCAKVLIDHGAEINATNSFGCTPLIQAVSRRHLEVVMLLINGGANLNIVTHDGISPLHVAAASGYSEMVRPLLAYKADVNMKNLDGDTPVKLAIKNKHDNVVKLLLTTHSASDLI